MPRKTFFCVLIILVFIMASYAYAGKVELTTYYPAPYGEYKDLKSKKLATGDDLPSREGDMRLQAHETDPTTWDPGEEGQIAYSNVTHKLYYFDGTNWVESGGGGGVLGAPTATHTFTINPNQTLTWTHNLGTTDYMVYMECTANGSAFATRGIHNMGVGTDVYQGLVRGANWQKKEANSIQVWRAGWDGHNYLCGTVTLRLWKLD